MKKTQLLCRLLILFFIITGLFSSCELDDLRMNDECEPTILENPEDRTFVLGVNVKNKDGEAMQGISVVMTYKKVYCTGETKGLKELEFANKTDENGYVFSGWQQTYTYGNEKDRVIITVELFAVEDVVVVDLGEYEFTYYWVDVDEEPDNHVLGFINKTYDIVIDPDIL